MDTDFTFAYGSNMNRSDLRSWLERNGYDSSLIVGFTPARLDGYDVVWNYYSSGRAGGAANLERRENSTVCGALIEFEYSLLKAFDRKEGHPYFYSRGDHRVPVSVLEGGRVVEAWLYLACPNRGARRDVWPSRDYKKICLDGAIELGLPEVCVEKIRAWPSQ